MHNAAHAVDLSLDLNEVLINKELMERDIARLGHIGTHIDIGKQSSLPIASFITQAHLIDVSDKWESEILMQDVQLEGLDIQANQSVLFKTRWMEHTGYGSKSYFAGHPFFSYDIFDYLISKKVAIVGVDSPGMRRSVEHKPLDEYCVERGLYILENIANLHHVSPGAIFTLCCFPLKLSNATGITCRVLAYI